MTDLIENADDTLTTDEIAEVVQTAAEEQASSTGEAVDPSVVEHAVEEALADSGIDGVEDIATEVKDTVVDSGSEGVATPEEDYT